MNLLKYALPFALIFATACSPKEKQDETRKPVLEVEGRFLYLDEIQSIVPNNISSQDSILLADSYIKKWVTDVLMYEKAKRNISNTQEIEKSVEDYRKTLILHQYQQDIIKQQLNTDFADDQLQEFYNQYIDEFVLDETIIKGLFIKVPVGAPKITNLREWLHSYSTKSLQNIEKYCVQNASTYDYFGDRWVNFSEITKNIFVPIENPNDLMGKNRFVELQDSTFRYFLLIEEFKLAGSTAPFEAAKERIRISLTNKYRIDFIKQFEEDTYKSAVRNGDINFFKEP